MPCALWSTSPSTVRQAAFLKEIAARQGISEKYLENILATLVRANMLSGMRGKGGGYVLTRPPEQYTVGEILRLTEGGGAGRMPRRRLQGLLAFGRVPHA